MDKLIRINNTVFAVFFLLAAITEFGAYALGYGSHCGWAALLLAILSGVIFYDLHKTKKEGHG